MNTNAALSAIVVLALTHSLLAQPWAKIDTKHEAVPEGEPFPSHIAPGALLPQAPASVTQGPFVSVQVNTTPYGMDIIGDAANEPSIAIDPTNPSNIAIGWRQFDTIASSFREAGYSYSRDGGKTWAGWLEHTPGVFRSDPVLRPGPDGELYYLSLRTMPQFRCDVFISGDFGKSWSEPILARGGDKAWFSIDQSDTPRRGNIYQHWSAQFTRSFDGGTKWEPRSQFVPIWGQQAISPAGEVYIAGIDTLNDHETTVVTHVLGAPEPTAEVDFVIVGDTGLPNVDFLNAVNPDGLSGQSNIKFDQGESEYHGRMYVLQTCHNVFPDDPADVALVYSNDNGASFSDVIRVNDDPAGNWQWFGTLSVAPSGRVDVIWNDMRDAPVGMETEITRLYASYSTDGGQTWAPNFPVSPTFDRSLGYPVQRKLGDYYDAHSDNLGMSVAYAATFNGGQDVYFLRIGETDCNSDGVPDQMQTAARLAPDCDADGLIDTCQARAGEAPPCYCPADQAPPFGLLDFDDVLAFLVAFSAEAPDADLAPPFGEVDFDDVIAFLTSFGAGCP